MSKYESRFAGFGGQGIVLAGVILAKAASLQEGKNAVQTQLYGPDSRGGSARCEVVISEEPIHYPKVAKANLLVLMSQEAADVYYFKTKASSLIIYDSGLVQLGTLKEDARHYPIEATRIAESLGNKMAANMVMLGAVSALTGLISLPSLLKTIEKSVPPQAVNLNLNAAKEGYRHLADREGLH